MNLTGRRHTPSETVFLSPYMSPPHKLVRRGTRNALRQAILPTRVRRKIDLQGSTQSRDQSQACLCLIGRIPGSILEDGVRESWSRRLRRGLEDILRPYLHTSRKHILSKRRMSLLEPFCDKMSTPRISQHCPFQPLSYRIFHLNKCIGALHDVVYDKGCAV